MQWTYKIIATPQPRVLARVLQLFDQQLIVVQSLTLTQTEVEIRVRISAEIEPALAVRLHAKLLHVMAVEDVQLETPATSETNDEHDLLPARAVPL